MLSGNKKRSINNSQIGGILLGVILVCFVLNAGANYFNNYVADKSIKKQEIYGSKTNQYTSPLGSRETEENDELLTNYLFKLSEKTSKNLPKSYDGLRLNSIAVSALNTTVLKSQLASTDNLRNKESAILKFFCNHREFRVALASGALIMAEFIDPQSSVGSEISISEYSCKASFGEMENFADYNMSVEPPEDHPKVAAYVFITFWFGFQDIRQAAFCPVASYPAPEVDQFNYYWSLLSMSLPVSKAGQVEFMGESKLRMESNIRKIFFDKADQGYIMLKEYAERQGVRGEQLCDNLAAASRNILNRQVETLKSCLEGDCSYGGGGKAAASANSYDNPIYNKYPEGHPNRAMYLYAQSHNSLALLNKLPECSSQSNLTEEHIEFVSKYNSIYNLSPPLNNVEATEMMNDLVDSFIEKFGQKGESFMTKTFYEMIDFYKSAGFKDSRMCGSIKKITKAVIDRQLDMLERCIDGECLNGLSP